MLLKYNIRYVLFNYFICTQLILFKKIYYIYINMLYFVYILIYNSSLISLIHFLIAKMFIQFNKKYACLLTIICYTIINYRHIYIYIYIFVYHLIKYIYLIILIYLFMYFSLSLNNNNYILLIFYST